MLSQAFKMASNYLEMLKNVHTSLFLEISGLGLFSGPQEFIFQGPRPRKYSKIDQK